MNAHLPENLSASVYGEVRGALLARIEETRQAYREACAAHTQGELNEAGLLLAKAAVDKAETDLGVLDNSVQEQRRLSDEQEKELEAEGRQRAVEAIEAEWGIFEESYKALIEGIVALGPLILRIRQADETIAQEAAAHRRALGSHREYGDLLHDLRDMDFRMSGLVHQSLCDAGLNIFVLGIGNMPPAVGNVDAASALEIKRRTISSLLGKLSRPAGED